MADNLTTKERSARMALIRSKHTKPERLVRVMARSLGQEYVLHHKGLPGTPDLVFPKLCKVIFVHGCFWHRHASIRCKLARIPKSNSSFWLPKLEQNRARDSRVQRAINRLGWRYIVVWECQLRYPDRVAVRMRKFLRTERGKK